MSQLMSCGHHLIKSQELDHPRYCPFCAAPLRETAEYFTKWDESQNLYQVRLVFHQTLLTSKKEKYFQGLAGEIASGSTCSCGEALSPSNYSIHREGEQIIFEGTYGCRKCREMDAIINPSITLLLLTADPTNASRLRLGEELREIQEKLQLAKMRDHFQLRQRMSVRPSDISQALLDESPNIVHFSGHGTSMGSLCFENKVGEIHPIRPDALAALFEQFATQVDCVLLNACYSEIQAKAIAKHIDYVIGMNKAIGDEAAIAFAIGFYQAVGAGRPIEDAYKLGCVQIQLQNIPEHLTPVLIKKE